LSFINLFHFSSLILYKVSKIVKYIIFAVLVLIAPFVVLLNVIFAGLIDAIQRVLFLFLGVYGSGVDIATNPFLSAGMLFSLSIVIIAISWLFLRRIEAK